MIPSGKPCHSHKVDHFQLKTACRILYGQYCTCRIVGKNWIVKNAKTAKKTILASGIPRYFFYSASRLFCSKAISFYQKTTFNTNITIFWGVLQQNKAKIYFGKITLYSYIDFRFLVLFFILHFAFHSKIVYPAFRLKF